MNICFIKRISSIVTYEFMHLCNTKSKVLIPGLWFARKFNAKKDDEQFSILS